MGLKKTTEQFVSEIRECFNKECIEKATTLFNSLKGDLK